MLRDAVSRTANAERNGGHKWVKVVREIGVSEHRGQTNEGPSETFRHNYHYGPEGFKGKDCEPTLLFMFNTKHNVIIFFYTNIYFLYVYIFSI